MNKIYHYIEPEFLTQESLRKKTSLLLLGSLKNAPTDFMLVYCLEDNTILASVYVSNGKIGDSFIHKSDLGTLVNKTSGKLSDLEPDLRRKEVYFYMSKVFVNGGDFVYDRLRLNDNIHDGKKTSGSINIKLKEVKASSKVKESGHFKGKVVLDSGEETGDEYIINKSSTYSDNLDDSMLIRSLSGDKTGACTIRIPYSEFKQVLQSLSNEYKAFFYFQLFPAINLVELKPYIDKIKAVKNGCRRSGNNSKFYQLKNKCLDRFIESFILTQECL